MLNLTQAWDCLARSLGSLATTPSKSAPLMLMLAINLLNCQARQQPHQLNSTIATTTATISDKLNSTIFYFIAKSDDVKEKKPDPSIYLTAAKKLGLSAKERLVVENSVIGLQAVTSAGMSCVITYTSSTNAIAIYPDLSNVRLKDLESLLENVVAAT
ncbi:hypothetical protein CsSME_00017077 [Camellia sinensis var. sinensis]